jgi:hypothetical protein
MGRTFAHVLPLAAVSFLVVPPPVVADTSGRTPFRDWIGDMPTAVNRLLDRQRRADARSPHAASRLVDRRRPRR